MQFGEIQHYGKKPSLLGLSKRPQHVVPSLFSLQLSLAQDFKTALFIRFIFVGKTFLYCF
jgi:hypothetical protein